MGCLPNAVEWGKVRPVIAVTEGGSLAPERGDDHVFSGARRFRMLVAATRGLI